MKKTLILFLCLIVATGMFFSCKKSESGGGTTTITFSRWASGTEEADYTAWLGEFMKENPNIKVVGNFLPYDEYGTKLRTDLISGNAADVVFAPYDSWYALALSNVFTDFNSFSDSGALYSQLNQGAVSSFVANGKQNALPTGIALRIPFINKGLFNQAGVPIPSQTQPMTTAEWVTMMDALRAGLGNDKMVANLFSDELFYAITLSAGTPYVSTDGTRVQATRAINAITEFNRIYGHPGSVTRAENWGGPWGTCDSAVGTGVVAICWTGNWSLGEMQENRIDYMSIPAPIVPGGTAAVGSYINCLMVPEASKNKDAAWTFVKWALGRDAQVKLAAFSDDPVNTAAAQTVAASKNAQDQNAYGGFGHADSFTFPPVPSDFNQLLGDLMADMQAGTITPQQFASQLDSQGQPMIDQYQRNR